MKHIHKLKKHKYAKTGHSIYFCVLPDCHYKIDHALALGKRTICNICSVEFVMTEATLKLFRPHCNDCGKVKVQDADGNTRYVKKVTNKVLTDIGVGSADNLRSRLNSIASPTILVDDGQDI